MDAGAKAASEAATGQARSKKIYFIGSIIQLFELDDELYKVLCIVNLGNLWPSGFYSILDLLWKVKTANVCHLYAF